MIKGIENVTLFSQNASELAHFYQEKVGLKITTEAELGEDNANLFELRLSEGSNFYIVDHSKVKGKNKQPERVIINFEVDDIEAEVKKLEAAQVKKIQDIYHVEDYGYIATFEDLDGNSFQLVKSRA